MLGNTAEDYFADVVAVCAIALLAFGARQCEHMPRGDESVRSAVTAQAQDVNADRRGIR
jgi:hypothetical protein